MCEWGNDVELLVPTKPDGSEWKKVGVDSCLAPMIAALNGHGIHTANCCCGHGKSPGSIILHDGRVLHIEMPGQTETVIEPWRTEAMGCGVCGHEWMAVAPAFVPSFRLECPGCKRRVSNIRGGSDE